MISPHEHNLTLSSAGIWLLQFAAHHLPTVTFDGIDISCRLFPDLHPANIRFSQASILELPTEWENAFAFVHQRLLIVALTTPMWRTAVAEIFRVTCPGGFVELVEPSLQWPKGQYSGKLLQIVHLLFDAHGKVPDLQQQLPIFLREAGFIDIHIEVREMPLRRSMGDEFDRCQITHDVFMSMKQPILAAGAFGIVESEEEFDELMDKTREDWDSIPGGVPYFTIYARKPCATKS
jgi:hypothetical protein